MMDYLIQYLSFFVIKVEEQGNQEEKRYQHYQTLDPAEYSESELKTFLDGELMRISKRKVDRYPKSEQVPTKIGRFLVEEGYDLGSNPNYKLFARIRTAKTKEDFLQASDELTRSYMETSSIRGGAFIVINAKLDRYFDEPFVFVIKCDFEQKVAAITDAKHLINHVKTAISAKNMKSIQYPYMPEEGTVEEWELKIHQSSHANYFEDFLRFVRYEQPLPEIVQSQVVEMAHQYIDEQYVEQEEEIEKEKEAIELWAYSPKRELQEKWTTEQVAEAASHLTQQQPELELKLKLDHIQVKALLADFAEQIHIAKLGDRYVVLIEGERVQFEKGVSPVELLRPEQLHDVMEKIEAKNRQGQ
jgi:hypothetical protein